MAHEPDDERPLLRSTRLPPATASALRSPHDDQRTRTQELRQALDDLRTEVEGAGRRGEPRERTARDPGPAAPTGPPAAPRDRAAGMRRLLLGVAAVAAVVLGVTGVVRVVAWSMGGGARTAVPAAPATAPPATTPATSAATAPTTRPAVTAPPPSPSAPGPAVPPPPGLPENGPGADAPGVQMVAALGAGGGTVEVYERLVVRPGTASVPLGVAPGTGLSGGLGDLPSTVTGLRVAVDGQPAVARADGAGWQVTPPSRTFTRVELRYRVSGALARPTPAPPGRGTLLLRPLTGPAATATGDPVLVRVTDRRVGSLYCPVAPRPLCGVAAGPSHVATVPAGAAPIVLAQVTLR